MTALQYEAKVRAMPADMTQGYILEMLEELTTIAQNARLTHMASILSLTLSAAQMDINSET